MKERTNKNVVRGIDSCSDEHDVASTTVQFVDEDEADVVASSLSSPSRAQRRAKTSEAALYEAAVAAGRRVAPNTDDDAASAADGDMGSGGGGFAGGIAEVPRHYHGT